MSNNARDVLERGKAAVKAKDRDEALYLLVTLTRQTDASPDQKAEAWLWLSQLYDDPAQKRACLENVLALQPAHPLARRGMALLEGRLKAEEVIDPDKPPAAAAPAEASARRYTCPQCGAAIAFEPEQRVLRCGHCGYQTEQYAAVLGQELERDFAAALPTARAHHWQLAEARLLKCRGCGADFSMPPARASSACPFCESPHVIQSAASRELAEPDGVVPFQSTADQATQALWNWLKKLRSRPSDLEHKTSTIPPRGVYVPFWTFDVGGEVRAYPPEGTITSLLTPDKADAQRAYRQLRQVERGDIGSALLGTALNSALDEVKKALPELAPAPEYSRYTIAADDVIVPASRSLPFELLNAMNDFTTLAMLPYSPDVLANWPTEIYQVSMADASLIARQRVFDQAKAVYGGANVRLDSAGMVINAYKLVLLPVWVTGYLYKGEPHPALVNGQTGSVHTHAPRGKMEKWLGL